MDYLELTIKLRPRDPWTEILMVELGDNGYESFVETEDGVNFKILATHETIGWVNPIDEDFDATLLTPFTIKHYQDIIHNSQSITEIAMRIFTKDNIHFSLKPYLHEGKMVIFQ